jgi:hypothetical protein
MIEQRLYYVIYEDEDGNEETTEVLSPNEDLVRVLMGPVVIIDIIEIDDPEFANNLFDGDDDEDEWDWSQY